MILQKTRRLAAAIDTSLPRQRRCARGLAAILSVFGLCVADPAAGSLFIVNTSGDPGPGGTMSLRQAIALANMSFGNHVEFDASLVGSTITLAGGQISINQTMYVYGPGADKLTISGNNASRIFLLNCPGPAIVYLNDLTLKQGHANLSGGAIADYGCNLYLKGSTITGSYAGTLGGGVFMSGAAAYVNNSNFRGNSAGFIGGGISTQYSKSYISRSTISGNSAGSRGGGLYTRDGYLSLATSTVSDNTTPSVGAGLSAGGGGVMIRSSKFVTDRSTIAYNYAYSGGGGVALYDAYSGSNATLMWSTIAGNSTCCDETGNGIVSAGGTASLQGDIVANNFNRYGVYDLAGSFKVDQSLVRNASGATISGVGSLFGLDPLLSRLGDHGGPTHTMLPAANSPVVDKIGGACPNSSDQRGLPRCVSGGVDMGSVERQVPEDIIFRDRFDSGR